MEITIVNIIQAMLAPGIMISACGLLLLSMSNKYSLVVARVRVLNEEKRKLMLHVKDCNVIHEEEIRLKSISVQLVKFQSRLKLVRDAVICYTTGVAFFILSSLFIGLKFVIACECIHYIVLGIFLLGMICVLGGVILAATEVWKGFRILEIEIREI
jgi:hypothetical protein